MAYKVPAGFDHRKATTCIATTNLSNRFERSKEVNDIETPTPASTTMSAESMAVNRNLSITERIANIPRHFL